MALNFFFEKSFCSNAGERQSFVKCSRMLKVVANGVNMGFLNYINLIVPQQQEIVSPVNAF